MLNGLAGQYFRLEKLYRAMTAKGLSEHHDEDAELIRHTLGILGAVCHFINAMLQTEALVAREAIQLFEPLCPSINLVSQAFFSI